MKIRRMLATAVAAAVTTPVVFLSAAPAFADTRPAPASTQKPAAGEDDEDGKPTYEELEAAVDKAQAKLDALRARRKALVQDLKDNNIDPALTAERDAAKAAVTTAEAARAAADQKLVTAQEALDKLPETATEEEKKAAEKAVADAKKAVEEAVAAKTAADLRLDKAGTAWDDARVALARKVSLLDVDIKLAESELADAEEALENFEEFSECDEAKDVTVALGGPKQVTAGTSTLFSLRVSNASQKTLDKVQAHVFAAALPDDEEPVDEETEFFERYITVEWSSADVLEWTKVTEKNDTIDVGKLVKGGHSDVKLRLTVDAEAPAGPGVAFAVGAYENNDGSCGIGKEYATADFEILAAKGDKPKPAPTPTPSATTPAPAPTTHGNTGTTQQGGSSTTPVNNGTLAATGANDTLPQLGLAAAGAVALGAGALVVARRRKAGSNA